MKPAPCLVAAIALMSSAAPVLAGGPPNIDPDWPCHQVKVVSFPLATVWSGPAIDLNNEAWRASPDVAALASRMSTRRVPVEEVQTAIQDFRAKEGSESKDKLLQAFGAAFSELAQQRSRILDGLMRFGKSQRAMGDRIREETEALHKAVDANAGGPNASEMESQQRLEWDLRVFNDRRQMVSYVCDAPAEIERRIGDIARAVEQAL